MRMTHILKKLYQFAFPFTCVLCRHPADQPLDLCKHCQQALPILPDSRLRYPLMDEINTFALFSYEGYIKQLILKLKFNQQLIHARLLGELLGNKLKTEYSPAQLPETIIPVPLHPIRIKERGFNQALEIAKPISRLLGIPIAKTLCQRSKPTLAQATLHAEQRKLNVKNAFAIKNPFNLKSVAILDDVITTGSTIRELVTTLKIHGITNIDVWCCARAPLRDAYQQPPLSAADTLMLVSERL